jgi:hypothetical protein
MRSRTRGCYGAAGAAGLVAVGIALVGLHGCGDACDEDTVDRAVAFLDANQTCATDADCVTVSDACRELPGGFCGQLPMNRQAADSAEWKAIERELRDCAPESCTVCTALLIPSCTDGSCRGRE